MPGVTGCRQQCVLLFSAQDVIINKFLLDKKDFAEMDDEEADLLRQRDLQRLQTMERYCQTTECLRNCISGLFRRASHRAVRQLRQLQQRF